MHIHIKHLAALLSLSAALASLAACGNVSHGVAKDGGSAGELVWPAPASATPMHRYGTFPGLDSLRQVHAGMNKPQIAALIGFPHFSEGVWGVREWNYLFHFRKQDSDEVATCQYKVLFDQARLARSFYWKPESCAALLREPEPAPVAAAAARHYTLSADALFAFDKSGPADILPDGRGQLDRLADELAEGRGRIVRVEVTGYTDRLGSEDYNRQLSQRRAETVRGYLATHGVPAGQVSAEGRGAAEPVVQCDQAGREALVACLAPNRRVEVVARMGDGDDR